MGTFLAGVLYIGQKNLWFEPKHFFHTQINDATGLSPGTIVTLSGLRVGEVEALAVDEDNKINVPFSVRKSLAHRIRSDSVAKVIRSFIIGEKRIEVVAGSIDQPVVANYGTIKGEDSREITDILTGQSVSMFVERIDRVITSVDKLVTIVGGLNPEDVEKTSKILYPTLKSINQMTSNIQNELLAPGLVAKTIRDVDGIAGPIAKRQKMIQSLLNNIQSMSQEIEASKAFASSVITALEELVITLRAMQKTWVLEEYVDKLKEQKKSSQDSKQSGEPKESDQEGSESDDDDDDGFF